jgi:hypothetical protein
MPVGTTTVIIEDTEYQIAQFTATRGLRYLKQLTQLLGASIAELFTEGDVKTQTVSADGLTKAVELLVENMDKVNFEVFIKDLLSATTVNNREINFDMEFAGRYNVLFELVFEVVKFNFGSVFTKGVLGKYLPS